MEISKPITRSKSSLKKYDLKVKNLATEGETSRPGLGGRSKSGLSRFSLLSHSTVSWFGKKKEKTNDEFSTKKNKEKSTEDLSIPIKKHKEMEKDLFEGKNFLLNKDLKFSMPKAY